MSRGRGFENLAVLLVSTSCLGQSTADDLGLRGSVPAPSGDIPPLVERVLRTQSRTVSDPEGLLARLDSRLDRLRTYSGHFTQVNYYAAAALADTFSGTVSARMPNDFVLLYDNPAGQFILSDGERVRMYVPENEQVVEGSIQRAGDDLNFFRLMQDFLGYADATVTGAGDSRQVKILPGSSGPVAELVLEVRVDDLLPRRIRVVDENRNISTYDISAIRVDDSIEDAVFQPTLPEGVEIFRQ